MKIHEYQAKEILGRHGVPVPNGRVASTPEEAAEIASELGDRVVVKAQIHAGGRGKAGGIKMASSPQEARQIAQAIIGTRLVTLQTGPEGVPVSRVLVEEAVETERELYLGMVIDGMVQGVVAIASAAGGMDIEEVAARTPDKILRATVDQCSAFSPNQARTLAYGLNLNPDLVPPVASLLGNLYNVFETYDCSLAEINPLVVTTDERLLAVDAKLAFR